jgi:hypothetical protein
LCSRVACNDRGSRFRRIVRQARIPVKASGVDMRAVRAQPNFIVLR